MLQGDRRQAGSPRDGVIARDQIARVLIDSLHIDAPKCFVTISPKSERDASKPGTETGLHTHEDGVHRLVVQAAVIRIEDDRGDHQAQQQGADQGGQRPCRGAA